MRLQATNPPNRDGFADLMKLARGAEARRSRQVPSGDTDGNFQFPSSVLIFDYVLSAIQNIPDVLLALLPAHRVIKKTGTGRP